MKKTITVSNEKKTINISKENSKLGMIPSFSVTAGTSGYCEQNCTKCYAKKLENMRSCVSECNKENYNFLEKIKECSTFDKLDITNQLVNIIDSLNCRYFRWNVAGDIDREYLKIIIDIAKKLKCITFYLYTKNVDVIENNITDIISVNNLIVNLSIMHYSKSYLISKYCNFKNIRFMITYRDKINEYMFYKYSYNLRAAYNNYCYCMQDFDNSKTCIECKECFNKWNKITFNEYRDLKVIAKNNLIDIRFLELKNCNFFVEKALKEVYNILINHTYTNILLTEKLMIEHKKTLVKLIKESNTFYIAICNVLDFMCSIIEKDYICIRQDIYNSSIFKASKNINKNVRLYDNNIEELKNVIRCYFNSIDIKHSNLFNVECFRISNIVYNKIDLYKYRYCNIKRIVFQDVNKLMNNYVSTC